jgi:GH18 family chitinase/PKD repeat protein
MKSFKIAVVLCFFLSNVTAQKVAGFFPDWVSSSLINNVKWNAVTDVLYAFSYPDAAGNLLPTTANGFTNILSPLVTQAHANGKKAHASCGGAASSGNFSAVVASAANRATFVSATSNLIQTYNLDGFNVDWEFPTGAEATNLALLITALKTEMDLLEVTMGKNLELSVAVAPLLWNNDGINASIISTVDYIYIMAFDAQGLCCVCGGDQHSTYDIAVNSMKKWTTGITPAPSCGDGTGKNAPASKLILSIPFYATDPYEGYNVFGAGDPALYFNDADGFIGTADYNSCPVIQQKTDMALNTYGAAGIWTWELSQDRSDQYSLTQCMADAVQTYGCSAPVPALGADQSICGSSSIILNSGVSTSAGRTFTWKKDGVAQVTGSSTATTYTVTQSGTYTVDVIEVSCSQTDEIIIGGTISAINLGGPYDLCNPASELLDAGISTAGITFAWQKDAVTISGETSKTYSATKAGTYTVTASASGCTSQTDNATVTSSLPTVTNDTICSPGTVNLAASASVDWYTALTGGSSINTGTTYAPSISANTTYYVQESGGATSTITTMRTAFQNDGWQQDPNVYATKFTALQDLTLNEVQVNAAGGSLIINIVASNGTTVVATKTFTASAGLNTLALNFNLTAGTYYINSVGSVSTLLVDLTPASNYSEAGIITVEGDSYWDWAAPYGSAYVVSGDYGFFINLKVTTGGSCERIAIQGVIDANHSSCTNTPPFADFNSDKTTACTGESIVFTDASTGGAADTYSWNFGSGATPGTASTVGPHTVTYSTEGTKTASLTVSNTYGNDTKTKTSLINITNTPGAAGSITGTNSLCIGSSNNYSINTVTGANTYTWVVPTGASITSGQGTTAIVVDFTGASSGNISVSPSNGCGTGTSAVLAVVVNPVPSDPGAITGTASLCEGLSGITYSITTISGATGYNWTVPSGATVTSGNGTNSITVDFSGASSGNFNVSPSNACGNSANSSSFAVTVLTVPSGTASIIGSSNICSGETNVAYTASPVTGATTYTWTVPNGATINSGQGTEDVSVSFGSTAGILTVTPSNSCGNATTASLTVSSNGLVLPIVEGFETSVPPASWSVTNSDQATTWAQTPVGANGTSSNSAYMNFINYGTQGQQDDINTPTIDFSGTSNHTLTFDHAYSWYDRGGTKNDKFDSLEVLVSTDCGSTFTQVWKKGGTTLTTTGGGQQGAFTPTSAQWINNSIDLSAYDGNGAVMVKFRGINQNGNNLFLDNINITGVTLLAPTADFSADVTSVCTGAQVTYTDNSTNGPTSWSWDFGTGSSPATATGQGPHQVTYSNSGTKTASLNVSNSVGANSKILSNYITVDSLPETTGNITGSASVCKANTEAYSISTVTGATSYTWEVPTGATIASGTGTNSITVNFTSAVSGNLSVTPVNGCGNGTKNTISIVVNDLPASPSSIAGSASVCQNQTSVNYSITTITEATSYTWTLPAGASIVGTSDTNEIVVNFGTSPGNVEVIATNQCGNSTTGTLAVAITNGAGNAGAVTGSTTACENESGVTYSIATVAGASTYTWTVPTGTAIASGQGSNSITVNFGNTSGNVTVTPESACGNGTAASSTVTVNLLPLSAGAITGSSTVCKGTSGTYSIAAVTGATSYTWVLPTGASITAGSSTNSITVSFAGNTSGNLEVTPVNSCGNGTAASLAVAVNDVPAIPGSITGVSSACENTGSHTYSISSVTNATSYTWTVPTGASISSGQGTESIIVSFGTTSGDVTVTSVNSCGNSASAATSTITITNGAGNSGIITGSSIECELTTGVSYSIATVTGTTNYNWSVPTGASITSGQGTNSIVVSFGSTSGNVSVTPESSCGNGTTATLAITVNPIPAAPGSITGSSSVCESTSSNYSITTIANATSYSWVIPVGASIIAGQGTTGITVDFGTATSGNIKVKALNGTCIGTETILAVTILSIPSKATAITGATTTCAPSTEAYSISTVTGATSYEWNYTGSNTTYSSITENISLSYLSNATSGKLHVKSVNTCGKSDSTDLDVVVTVLPNAAGSITGANTVCKGTSENYSISIVTGATSHTWTVPTGASITAGSGTNNITVNYAGTTSGNIEVTPVNACGNGTKSTLAITVNDIPAAPNAITGVNNVCENTGSHSYSVASVTGATSYTWTVPTGASISSGQGTENVVITFGNNSGDVSVSSVNTCGSSATSSKVTVLVNQLPSSAGAITGTSSVCELTTGSAYSIATVSGATTYNWSVPTGSLITSGQTTNAITVDYASTSGNISVTPQNSCGDGTPAILAVSVNTTPVVSVNNNTICDGDAAAIFTATSATAISYLWSGNGTGTASTTNGTASGTYTVSITDINGCSNSANGVLTVNSNTVSLGSDISICSGSSTILDAGIGGVTYAWNTAETTQTISVSTAGEYHVSVIDANGCTGKDTLTVTLGAGLTIALGNDQNICTGSSITLDATNSGASYLWNTGATTQTISTSNAGSYNVTATDGNGCVGKDTIIIGLNSLPTVSLGTDLSICEGSNTTLDAGNTGSSYAWSTGATTQTINVSNANSYNVTVTDVNGCIEKDTLVLSINTKPTVTVNDATICFGDAAATFTATAPTATSYLWSSNGSGTSNTASGTTAGSYVVTVTDANTCSNSATGTLTINSLPNVSVADAAICNGDPATTFIANAPTAVSYVWSENGSGTNSTTSGSTAGNYTVTVIDANTCSNSATAVLTINPIPTVTVNSESICTGDAAATLTATSPTAVSYLWSNNGVGTASTTSGAIAGTYTVSVTDVLGCSNAASGTLTVNSLPFVSVNNAAICDGDAAAVFTTTSATATSYLWSGNGTGTNTTTSGTTAGTYTVSVTDANNCSNSADGMLTVNNISVNLGVDKTICLGSATTLDAGITGATYVWNTGASTQSISVSTSGVFDVIVTDGNGCVGKDTVQVGTGAALTVSLGTDVSICIGDNATLNAGNVGATYLWNTAETTQNISVNTTGTYDVIVTDGNGCTGNDTVIVTVNTLPIVNVNDAIICAGDPAANFIATAPTASTYVWSDNGNGTNASTSGTTSGNYTVTITDANGCTASAFGTLTVNTLPSVTVNDNTVCEANLPATISSIAPTAVNYAWSGNGTGTASSTSASVAGIYTLSVTDANGCANTANGTLTINSINVDLGTDKSICAGSSAIIDAGNTGSTYLWNTGATSQNITVNTGAQYEVAVTGANGCVGKDTVVITVGSTLTVDLGVDKIMCSGTNVTLDAGNPGNTYNWNTGATSQAITVSSANSYHVTVTDGSGCTGRDTIVVTIAAGLTVDLGLDQNTCTGNNVTFDAGNTGATYLWNTAATSQTIATNNTGSYDVIVSDANGCVGRDTVTLTINPLPTVSIDPAFETNYDVNSGNISLTFGQPTGGTYTGAGVSGGVFSTTTAGVGSHNVIYNYTDGNGCSNSTTLTLNVSFTTGVSSVTVAHKLSLYPNPFSHHLNINFSTTTPDEVSYYSIVDERGRLVLSGEIVSIEGEVKKSINTEILERGFYYFTVINSSGAKSMKVIKFN